jgi:hypothetical protein
MRGLKMMMFVTIPISIALYLCSFAHRALVDRRCPTTFPVANWCILQERQELVDLGFPYPPGVDDPWAAYNMPQVVQYPLMMAFGSVLAFLNAPNYDNFAMGESQSRFTLPNRFNPCHVKASRDTTVLLDYSKRLSG